MPNADMFFIFNLIRYFWHLKQQKFAYEMPKNFALKMPKCSILNVKRGHLKSRVGVSNDFDEKDNLMTPNRVIMT